MELEAGWVVWSIRRLRRYSFGVYFLVFTDHQCLQQICKIGETKPRIQRWMEFLSAYNFRLSYRRGQENANADFLSRLPLPPIADDVSGASALTDPDDLGVYLIRACGLTTPSCPVPGVGLDGLVSSPDIPVLGGLAPSPDTPVLGGLPLTSDDFRTPRAPIPSPSATNCPRRPRATFPQAPYTTYAIIARDGAPRPTRRTRSQTAILDGNTPSRPDYRTAAHSGFDASAAAASPPLRTSPPPRSARLGFTTSPGRRAPISSTPPPADPQSVPPLLSTPLHPTPPDPDVQAAAAHLSNTLLNYSHSDWEQAQREDPLCDATRRYVQLGCPQHQNLDRDQLAYCNLARERQQRAYGLVRKQHALAVAQVNGRNSALSDALLRRSQYAAGGWVWVYNSAATIRQGLRKGADNKVLKEKLSLNWTGPFKIIAVGPAPAADTPDGRPLGDKLLYLDLPSNLSGPAAKPRVTVARCKPCANPYDADNIPRHLPARPTQYVLHAFATKSPPYHVTTDDVSSPPILIDVAKITGHQ